MNKGIINYSQCWEDPKLLNEALALNSSDTVLSITSGGDNTLFLLLNSPKSLTSLDLNPAQNYLLELKIAAIKSLNHDEFLEFTGVKKSSERVKIFNKVKHSLSPKAYQWWSTRQDLIARGIIHCGRFERFLKIFRQYVLPLVHSRRIIITLLNSTTLQDQKDFYERVWDSNRWRLLFRIVTSRFILKNFARQRELFSHTVRDSIALEYGKRLHNNFISVPLSDNYFMHYCLMGTYGKSLPLYLEKKSHSLFENNQVGMPFIVTSDLLEYLGTVPDDTFSKFNLSDVFEALSLKENDAVWQEIIRTAKKGAIVAYWNNLVPRSYPQRFSNVIKDDKQKAQELHSKDRLFFYESFHINSILK